jgi:hypothetical protein
MKFFGETVDIKAKIVLFFRFRGDLHDRKRKN